MTYPAAKPLALLDVILANSRTFLRASSAPAVASPVVTALGWGSLKLGMGRAVAVWLLAQGVVFTVWAVVAFGALFRLLGVMQRQSGQALPGFRTLAQAPGVFLRDPVFASDRRRLPVLTVVLLALSAGFAALR